MIIRSILSFITVFILAFISSAIFADSKSDIQSESKPSEAVGEETHREIHNSYMNLYSVFSNRLENSYKANNSGANKTLISCILKKHDTKAAVEIVNATRLSQVLQFEQNVTHKGIPGTCVLVLFYSSTCPFSCMMAPYFNALPRFFPDIKMVAMDAIIYRNFNVQFGIFGTPTLMLFHGGRPAVKFNVTTGLWLEAFASFITKHTGIRPKGSLFVTPADFAGPVSSIVVEETDYYLFLAWLVIAARILYSLYNSTWGRHVADATLNAWREAEAQHHHLD